MTKPLLTLRLAGTQEEMGAQHGRLVADDAARLFQFYKTMPERALAGDLRGAAGAAGRAVVRTIATAWQARLARERPADFVARSRAFIDAVRATGVDVPREALLALATMDAMQNCVSLAARGKLGPFASAPILTRAVVAAAPACSTVIAWGDATSDGELLFGRNFDFPGVGVWDQAPAFVLCAPPGGQRYGFFTTRGADAPVVTVVNEAGLVIAPHTRWHRGVTFSGAMIVDVIHEIARSAETLDDAVRIARSRPISSSWGIAIGSSREKAALVIEVAGPAVDVVRPSPGASYLVCTNRYRSPALQAGQLAASEAWAIHSEHRERRLRVLVEGRDAPLTAETIARFLGDRHDVDDPKQRRHLGAIVAQATNVHCAVVTPSRHMALVGVDHAPCCEGTWAELSWGRCLLPQPETSNPVNSLTPQGTESTYGFTTRLRTDLVAPHTQASRHVYDAARAYETSHDVATALAALERAIGLEPDDPSLRLPAAWLALEAGRADRAVIHVHAGLACETESYRRGQLLLWGARAARRADPAAARLWTDELARSGPPELAAAARRRFRGRPHVNLMMADAY